MKNILSAIKSVLVVEFQEGEMIPVRFPWLYGKSWMEPCFNSRRVTIIAMPVPLNLIAKVVRGAWGRMRYPARWMKFGDESAAYAAGRRDGISARITDDDIAAFLLRKKISEVNSEVNDTPKNMNFPAGLAQPVKYHQDLINQYMSSYLIRPKIFPSPFEQDLNEKERLIRICQRNLSEL